MTENDYVFVVKLLRERGARSRPGSGEGVPCRSRGSAPVAKRHGLGSPVAEFIQNSARPASANGLTDELVEAMVTTETSFFRDIHPFDALRKTVLPELIQARQADSASS